MIKKHKKYRKQTIRTIRLQTGALLGAALLAGTAGAQVQARQPGYPVPGGGFTPSPSLQLPPVPVPTPVTPNGRVVEDVIVRVNGQIITRTEYERAQQQMLQEAQQQNVPPADFQERTQNMLRDMIDQQLLLSKAKDLGISGDAETMRRLDDIRKQNHLDSMEALERAASQQGVSFEDFKQSIRNNVVTQQVVRDEVGRRINMTRGQEEAYYAAHSKEFELPEQVHLSEILVPTPENATDAQIAKAQSDAEALEAKLKAGADFAALAKSSSGGPTASAGGDLGDFKRGALGDVLEKATFSLPKGGFTAPIRTRQGFVILKVDNHQAAGVPPLADVEPQVQEAIYVNALQPALRAYLTKARDEAYILIKDGFVDTGSNRKTAQPLFTTYTPPPVKKKVIKHQQAELERAKRAQEQLAIARAKVEQKNREKALAQAAKSGGVQNASKPVKPPKIHREKIRYGQAPRNALPAAPLEEAETATESAPLQGQAPGVAMAPRDNGTVVTAGTGVDPENPLAPQAGPQRKTRFSDRQNMADDQKAQTTLVKAQAKASVRPLKATSEETADEKQQAAPLGLNGETVKKKKPKRAKGDPKERLQDRSKPEEAAPVAPTANPNLVTTPTAVQSTSAPAQTTTDTTTLPPAGAPAPGAPVQGQPVPATTSAQPNAPATTPVPR